jgi:hypothetical protein
MASSGIRQFKSFVADFRSLRSLALKAAIAAPWAGIWTKLAPPPALWSAFLSSLAECLILVWAFKFWSESTADEHARRMKLSLALLCITALLSIASIQLFSVSPGPGRERVVVGFRLQPPMEKVLSATYTAMDALRDSGFDATAVWTAGSVTLMQVTLNILWVAMFASLSVYLVSFMIGLRNGPRRVGKRSPAVAQP